jgi:hypothetical protein
MLTNKIKNINLVKGNILVTNVQKINWELNSSGERTLL